MKKLILSLILSSPLGVEGVFAQSSTILPSSIQLPNVAVLGTCTVTEKGQQVFLTTDNKSYYCNGSTWVESSFSLPYSGMGLANAPTHLFKLENTGSGFVAHFTVNNASNTNGGLFISNLGVGFGINSINSNVANTNPAVRGQTLGTGFAADFSSLNGTPKALKTTGGLQLTGIGESANKILTSDATGNATWQTFTVPTSTNYYNASNLDFMPVNNLGSISTPLANFRVDINGTCYFDNNASSTENFQMFAQVDLQDGATITRLKTFYIDNTSAEQLTVQLIRRLKTENPQTDDVISTNLSAVTINTALRTVQATVSANNVVDNNLYHYYIRVKIGEFTVDPPGQQWRGNILAIRNVEVQYNY